MKQFKIKSTGNGDMLLFWAALIFTSVGAIGSIWAVVLEIISPS